MLSILATMLLGGYIAGRAGVEKYRQAQNRADYAPSASQRDMLGIPLYGLKIRNLAIYRDDQGRWDGKSVGYYQDDKWYEVHEYDFAKEEPHERHVRLSKVNNLCFSLNNIETYHTIKTAFEWRRAEKSANATPPPPEIRSRFA